MCCVAAAAAAEQEILDVEQVMEENQGMELNAENVDQVRAAGRSCVVSARSSELVARATIPRCGARVPALMCCAALRCCWAAAGAG
jgi:hypothetical protein